MKTFSLLLLPALLGLVVFGCDRGNSVTQQPGQKTSRPKNAVDLVGIRFATFNIALNRNNAGDLIVELEQGQSKKICQVAEVIQRVRPDVILLNEIDYDDQGRSVALFREKFLGVSQNGQAPIEYPHVYVGPVNTGVKSELDINQDGKIELPDDGFGFGAFPGQYGMALLSQYPIDEDKVRSFQNFLWKDMPNARVPKNPDGSKFYADEIFSQMRLSSKSHWDIPVLIDGNTVHMICSHPTPPVFDGPEDRNGCRNHDEIRMIADYVTGKADYLYDDNGVKGGLETGDYFVIVGDLNADPVDGDSLADAARLLTECPIINNSQVPSSQGGVAAAAASGSKNNEHQGDPAHDTGDFNDAFTGNMRIDYCLPAARMKIIDAGVFWPGEDEAGVELNNASDHHLVWVELQL